MTVFRSAYKFMLRRLGQKITLKRERPQPLAIEVYAKVRYVKPDEIIGGVLQNDLMVVVERPDSPWDGSEVKKGDRLIINGKLSTVEFSYPLHEGETLVGYRLIARG